MYMGCIRGWQLTLSVRYRAYTLRGGATEAGATSEQDLEVYGQLVPHLCGRYPPYRPSVTSCSPYNCRALSACKGIQLKYTLLACRDVHHTCVSSALRRT